jgi:hypothetical protein
VYVFAERYQIYRLYGRVLTPDGLRLICAALDYDPEKIGKHMLEMLAKFRNEGIIELNLQDNSKKIRADGIDRRQYV